ncbi:MAG TPA: 2,3-bisphosphoglycerate-independent phosphoglycerate mutase [Thermoanaerobaculia bacterium]|nr:2,3-bisphosphoglycerate-independent phosphoglycerate mutase [Thermoanaerobaculia bacterium]
MKHYELLARLAQPAGTRIVLLVLDGVGDLRTTDQPRTALELAATPNLDALAARAALGRILPVAPGITPGSGPGHLALFGYDPTSPEADIGRGVLEALGEDLEIRRGDVAVRGNFATADADGRLTDRRAGRIPTSESERLSAAMQAALDGEPVEGVEVLVEAGEGHRFVLRLRGVGPLTGKLSPDVADTDPQQLGVEPLPARATGPAGEITARAVARAVEVMNQAIANEPQANRVLLRGFSKLPDLPPVPELYQMRCGAFAGYPLYRGVASACGMEVVPCGKKLPDLVAAVAERWDDFDFFFLHVKSTDMAGEDGDVAAKARTLEEIDRELPRLLELAPDVLAITGDHSTPAPLAGHSWHPVPLLVASDRCFADDCQRFDELEATRGHLGTIASMHLMGLLLANAGRLAKYGA